ncbi:MAG: patatin-like phospholipase family protein, partial [Solirubrobacterales bacterium]|nr:patatin-like phospholipase family protein [Solirubrobacterales bacterium]
MHRVGVVLGAGGITGIAWLMGALEAVRAHTGWEPGTARVVSGTSAGAVAATVLAAGIDPEELLRMAEEP